MVDRWIGVTKGREEREREWVVCCVKGGRERGARERGGVGRREKKMLHERGERKRGKREKERESGDEREK